MVSVFILVFSVIALVRLGISQWRAIWIATANQPLSDSFPLAAGIDRAAVGAGDFSALLQLCNLLTPDLKKTTPRLARVSCYYHAAAKLEQVFKMKLPSISTWATGEMHICARYAAVVFDQNLSMNLDRQLAARGN